MTTQPPLVVADHDELSQIAAEVAESYPLGLLPPGSTRRWVLARETLHAEAWIIVWPPGTGLRLHDHAGSLASVKMISGRLRERTVAIDGTSSRRWLESGNRIDLPADHRHEVINLDDVDAVSVHVYSPPLGDTSFRNDKELSIFAE